MKAFASVVVAAGLIASSVMSLHGQDARDSTRNRDRERGPSAREGRKGDDLRVTGGVTRIDPATKTVFVRAERIPGHPGKTMTMEYQVKDSSDLEDFQVGEKVVGELEKEGQAPPRLAKLKKMSKDDGANWRQADPNRKPGRVPGVGVDTTISGGDLPPDDRGSMGRDSARTGGAGVDTSRKAPRY